MKRVFLFRLPNDIGKLMALAAQIRELDEYRRLDGKTAYALDLALEEMAGNIIKYGYDVAGEQIIEIVPEGPEVGHVDGRRIGGVGVYLVRKMVRSMEYRRENGRNVLTLHIDRGN